MRILQIITDLRSPNGVSEVVLNLSDGLLCHDVVIATTGTGAPEMLTPLLRPEVRLVRFKASRPRSLVFSWRMFVGLDELVRSADVVHVHGAWTFPVWWGCHLALKRRTPLIRTPHGSFGQRALQKSAAVKRLAAFLFERRSLRKATFVHATSESEAQELRAYDQRIGPVVVVPNGVACPDWVKRADCRRAELKTVLFLSRLNPLKGVGNLIAAWAALTREWNEQGRGGACAWRLVIAGPDDGGYRGAMERLACELGCKESLVFMAAAYGDAKWSLYREADLFVLPTLGENFGIVIGEALACGVPVITTKEAPWQELLGGSEVRGQRSETGTDNRRGAARTERGRLAATDRCGWWVDSGVEPLAAALKEAMGLTDEERHLMGQNGVKLVAAKYQWKSVVGSLQQVYERCVKSGCSANA